MIRPHTTVAELIEARPAKDYPLVAQRRLARRTLRRSRRRTDWLKLSGRPGPFRYGWEFAERRQPQGITYLNKREAYA